MLDPLLAPLDDNRKLVEWIAHLTGEPNEEVRQRNVDAAIRFFGAMRAPSGPAAMTRFAPGRTIPSLESFYGLD